MAMEHFADLVSQVLTLGTQRRRRPPPLNDQAVKILGLLGLGRSIFEVPPRRWGEIRSAPLGTSGM
jgi:hypothetical protein